LWLIPEKLYYPLLFGDLIVKTELDLGDRSEWIRIERDSSLSALHNGDVCILCGWLNFGKKSCVLVSLILIYFLFLFKICSCLELDLTLHLNTRVYVASNCSRYFSNSILSSLLMVSLSGPRRIVFAPGILFRYMKFLVIGHIRSPNQTYPAKPGHI
jgi:hypothetical protein